MKIKSFKKNKPANAGRVVVNLDREEFEFIDKIGRDALFSTGRRLTNNKIVRVFVDVMKGFRIDGSGMRNCEELKGRVKMVLGMKQERRMYYRFKKGIEVSWRRLESMDEYEEGYTRDISEEGFRIGFRKRVRVGDNVEFTIRDPNNVDRPIKAIGQVVWLRAVGGSGGIEGGVRLTYVPEEEKGRFKGLFYEGIEKESQPKDIEQGDL